MLASPLSPYSTTTSLTPHQIKAHLSPLEEEAADLNAKIDIRDIIEGIEDHRLKKLLKLCKEKRGKEEEEDVTIEFERALKVEMMMHRAASPEHNREGVWGIGA